MEKKGLSRCGLCLCQKARDAGPLLEDRLTRRLRPHNSPVAPPRTSALIDEPLELGDKTSLDIWTTTAVLRSSIGRGCRGCLAIWQAALACLAVNTGWTEAKNGVPHRWELTWLVGNRPDSDHSLDIALHWGPSYGPTPMSTRKTMDMVLEDSRWHSRHPSARQIPPAISDGYTGSSASLKCLKSWIQECRDPHQTCKQHYNKHARRLPDRVLRLTASKWTGSISVRLFQQNSSSPVRAPYAALSHRWGPSTLQCRTTKQNLPGHLCSIPWSQLPKTFRDAATVTVYLGLQYLWIDSLCIVQDDQDDWKVQAAKMCDVYSGSYVTLAASSSADSDVGLFHRSPFFPVVAADGSRATLRFRETPIHTPVDFGVPPPYHTGYYQHFPLLTRGWVFQERLLSPRMAYFSGQELSFACTAGTRCACGRGSSSKSAQKLGHEKMLSSSKLDEVSLYWHHVVRQYSALRLSFPSDRLPALAGVARQVGSTHRALLGRYVAGLWEHTLLMDLHWYVSGPRYTAGDGGYSGPTWSWAAVMAEMSVLSSYPRARKDLEIVSFDVALAGLDEFGPVSSGEITVSGTLVTGSLVCHDDLQSWTDKSDAEVCFQVDGLVGQHVCLLDFEPANSPRELPVAPGSKAYCLPTGFIGDGCHICLILRAVDDAKQIFERIGIMTKTRYDAVQGWLQEKGHGCTVTLV